MTQFSAQDDPQEAAHIVPFTLLRSEGRAERHSLICSGALEGHKAAGLLERWLHAENVIRLRGIDGGHWVDLYVDELGALKHLPLNRAATAMWRAGKFGESVSFLRGLHGDVAAMEIPPAPGQRLYLTAMWLNYVANSFCTGVDRHNLRDIAG